MILLFMKVMLLYLIAIGHRLGRCVRFWWNRICKFFQKKEEVVSVGEPVLREAEIESKYFEKAFHELMEKCEAIEIQKPKVQAEVNSYRVLKRKWEKLLTGVHYSVRSSQGLDHMIEKAILYLVSAQRDTMLAKEDFASSHQVVETYEETMNSLMELLIKGGLVESLTTKRFPRSSNMNDPLFHILRLREEVLFLQRFIRGDDVPGSPQTWEEMLSQFKESL